LDSSDGERIDRDAVDQPLPTRVRRDLREAIDWSNHAATGEDHEKDQPEATTKKAVKKVDNSRKRVARRLVR
jgi:hypothetical protein